MAQIKVPPLDGLEAGTAEITDKIQMDLFFFLNKPSYIQIYTEL